MIMTMITLLLYIKPYCPSVSVTLNLKALSLAAKRSDPGPSP